MLNIFKKAYGKELKAMNDLITVYINCGILNNTPTIDVSSDDGIPSSIYDRVQIILQNHEGNGGDYSKAMLYIIKNFHNLTRLTKINYK